MSHIDIRTTLSYQQNNPLAVSLVFNPERLIKQIELANKKGDPVVQLNNDPGFKIYRLDDVNKGAHSGYHEVDYKIEGFESMEQLVKFAHKFVIEATNFFPKDNLCERYEKYIEDRYTQLNSLLLGTEEYLKTLARQGELSRIPEVLENQKKEINKFVGETFIKIENIKEFMDYLEYKERETVIPKVNEILAKWHETIPKINEKIKSIKELLGNII